MTKKKVFCYNCAYFIKGGFRSRPGDLGSLYLNYYDDRCGNPTKGFGTKKVKATYKKPAHTMPITIPPEVINKDNDCTGWMFLAEKPEYQKKKPWWKVWS